MGVEYFGREEEEGCIDFVSLAIEGLGCIEKRVYLLKVL